MAAGNLILALCLLITVFAVTKAKNYVFSFGNYSIGEEYYRVMGSIPGVSFSYKYVNVPEHKNMLTTGIHVTVSGVSYPSVSYKRPWVSIKYYFPQLTASDYKVIAKAVPCRPCERFAPTDVLQYEYAGDHKEVTAGDFVIYGEL